MNKIIFGALFILLLSILLNNFYLYKESGNVEKKTYNSFIRILQKTETNNAFSRIAVGYNTNVDLIVDGIGLLKELKLDPSKAVLKASDDIDSIESFYNTFIYFFEKGSAAERIIVDDEICKLIIETSQRLDGLYIILLLYIEYISVILKIR